jgi:glycine dehydrogenase subunit 2
MNERLLRPDEPLLNEMSRPGHKGYTLPSLDVPDVTPESVLPPGALRRTPADLPEVEEPGVVRHFTRLSTMNFHVDRGLYPLGSCTMKYNPKINDEQAAVDGFRALHPLSPELGVQGALALLDRLATALAEIVGLPHVALQPAAGAQGELLGMLVTRAYHTDRGDARKRVLIPDSAHGTNPASVALAGYEAVTVPSGADGLVDLAALKRVMGPDVAAIMITNPNTLGIFERDVREIARLAHEAGALVYLDGANLNALLGIVRPGDMGFDITHMNLHKTFSTPHGGGGPGSGPIAVTDALEPYLPVPRVVRRGETYRLDFRRPKSVGRVHAYYGNFGIHVRAYTYIRMLGAGGLRDLSEGAILNANYLKKRLAGVLEERPPGPCMHEFVLCGSRLKEKGVRTLDVAKRLLDFDVYAPTIYFPLIVPEALMIEPTESESLATLDRFAEVVKAVVAEAESDPETVKTAPHRTPVSRLDDGKAARELRITWKDPAKSAGPA